MLPVLIVILMINFAVPRLRTLSFAQVMSVSEQGMQNEDAKAASAEAYLGTWRRTGRDLPALINLRVWKIPMTLLSICGAQCV